MVKGFRKKEIAILAKRDFAAGSNPSASPSEADPCGTGSIALRSIVTDGLSGWRAVSEAGCDHFPAYRSAWAGAVPFGIGSTALPSMVTGAGSQAAKWVPFTLRRP